MPDVQTLPEEVTNTLLLQKEATTTTKAPKKQATNPAAKKEPTTITGKVYTNLKSVPKCIQKVIRQLIRNGITRYDQQRVELILGILEKHQTMFLQYHQNFIEIAKDLKFIAIAPNWLIGINKRFGGELKKLNI